jgi:hypothetical protein
MVPQLIASKALTLSGVRQGVHSSCGGQSARGHDLREIRRGEGEAESVPPGRVGRVGFDAPVEPAPEDCEAGAADIGVVVVVESIARASGVMDCISPVALGESLHDAERSGVVTYRHARFTGAGYTLEMARFGAR